MSEQQMVRQSRLRREKELYRYSSALERGDLDMLEAVLHDAERDSMLVQMILEIHEVEQIEQDPLLIEDSMEAAVPSTHLQKAERVTPFSPRRHRRIRLSFRILIAVLAISLLVGLPFAFGILPRTIPQPVQTVLPGTDSSCYMGISPGLRKVCDDHLYQRVGVSEPLGSDQLDILQTYADANELVVVYAFSISAGAKSVPTFDSTLLTPPEVKISKMYREFPTYTGQYVRIYDVEAVKGNPKMLQLHWKITNINLHQPQDPSRGMLISSSLDFGTPFYAGYSIATHQTAIANGAQVTLEHMTVTPSSMRLTFQGKGLPEEIDASLESTVLLQYDGQRNHEVRHGTSIDYYIDAPLSDKHGNQAILLSPKSQKPPVEWTFRVNLP